MSWRAMIPVALLLLGGCGGMRRSTVGTQGPEFAVPISDAGRMRVAVGEIANSSDIPDALLRDVKRFLIDKTKVSFGNRAEFLLVETEDVVGVAAPEVLQSGATSGQRRLQAQGLIQVEILEIEEKLGATVKIGVYSSQKKLAVAKLRVTIVCGDTAKSLSVTTRGRAEKGAWGLVASVQRKAMRTDGTVWDLDNSMIGIACARALDDASERLARQLPAK